MEQLIDISNLETSGYRYNDYEAETAIVALGFYVAQIRNGNIPMNNSPRDKVEDVTSMLEEIKSELDSGSRVILPIAHNIVSETVLPYICRLHEKLPYWMYEGVCQKLDVKPADLIFNALDARNILNQKLTLALSES